MRMRTAFAAASVIAVLATACGGSDDTVGSDAAPTSSEAAPVAVPPDIEAAVQAIEADWQEADALGAVLLAIDAGYALDQIVEHPTIADDGAIEGVEPAGVPTALIGDPPSGPREGVGEEGMGEASVQLVGYSPGQSPSEAYVVGIERSIEEIWRAAQEHLADQEAERLEAVNRGSLQLTMTMLLLERGYSLDQVVESLFFGTFRLGSYPCVAIEDDPPVIPRAEDGMAGCGPLSGDEGTTTTTTTSAGPAGTDPPPSTTAGEPGDGTRFEGAIGGDVDTSATIIRNEIELFAGDDLTGSISYVAEYRLTEGSQTVDCFAVHIVLEPGSVTSTGEGTYSGSVSGEAHSTSTTCPAGGVFSGPPTEVAEGTLSVTISGDTLSGSWGEGGGSLTFTATRAP